MKKRVIVIGAGASGMMAAVAAAGRGALVTLIEKKEQPGKKLLKTGNGKCNYSNFYLTERNYHGHHPEFAGQTVRRFHTEDLIRFFETLGMLSYAKETYLYPSSERAETVVHVFKNRLKALGVTLICKVNVISVTKENKFTVYTSAGRFEADSVILAMGSEASVKDPYPYEAYKILKAFGHHIYPALPALVPLYGSAGIEEYWDGVRIQATVGFKEVRDTGELQLTRNGISGIPVFQISRSVVSSVKEGEKTFVEIDFLPHYDRESLISFLQEERMSGNERKLKEYLAGWLPEKLVFALSKQNEVLFGKLFSSCIYDDFAYLVDGLKSFQYEIQGYGDLSRAQTVSGGLDTEEITENMESRLIPGLFVCGELLDVDGMCGGYNLHFAFASGYLAGEAAGE